MEDRYAALKAALESAEKRAQTPTEPPNPDGPIADNEDDTETASDLIERHARRLAEHARRLTNERAKQAREERHSGAQPGKPWTGYGNHVLALEWHRARHRLTLKRARRLVANSRRTGAEDDIHSLATWTRDERLRGQARRTTLAPFYKAPPHRDRCEYCGGPFDHLDHVPPIARAHEYDPRVWQLVPSCTRCNVILGAKPRSTVAQGRKILKDAGLTTLPIDQKTLRRAAMSPLHKRRTTRQ